MTQRRCTGTTKAGGRCNSFALPGSPYCVTHHPDRVADLERWRKQGGSASSNRSRAAKQMPPAMSGDDLQRVLSAALKALLAGRVEPGVANAAASLGRAIAAIKETTELERRLEALEQAAAAAQPSNGRWTA